MVRLIIKTKRFHLLSKWFIGGVLFCFLGLATFEAAVAQITPINFNGFSGTGIVPTPAAGQLDSNIWRISGLGMVTPVFGGTYTSAAYTRGTSTGGASAGGIYAFDTDAAGNISLGIQPNNSNFTPGAITLWITNTTASTVDTLFISYDILVYNDENRANSFNFAYSTDDTTYTPVPVLNYSSPAAADAAPTWTTVNRNTSLSGLGLSPGAAIFLQWTGDDVTTTGQRDEFGLDNIEVRINSPTAVSLADFSFDHPPSISNTLSLVFLLLLVAGTVLLFTGRQVSRP